MNVRHITYYITMKSNKPKLVYYLLTTLMIKWVLLKRCALHRIKAPPDAINFRIDDPVAWFKNQGSNTILSVEGDISFSWLYKGGCRHTLRDRISL